MSHLGRMFLELAAIGTFIAMIQTWSIILGGH